MFSKTAMTVDRAAKDMNTKNRACPSSCPPGMLLNTFGRVTNTRPGPEPGVDAEGETGREDDEARHERDDRCRAATMWMGFAGQGAVLVDVAAENGHGADAEARG